ncbi:hypothetical protein DFH11DRAFT_1623495 [Phellopilus nigrolimitatus]|nr:hypothetical protein DFH11DRAFT_1623495 [Phellopilus nigrolimitatus]
MPFNLFSKNASRKFVDLIHDVSNKYANLDPPQLIQAGDYGKINNETGQFDREGNIYHNESLAELAGKTPAGYDSS